MTYSFTDIKGQIVILQIFVVVGFHFFLPLNNTAKGVNSSVIMESGVVVTAGLGFVFTEVSRGGCIYSI